MRRTSVFLSFLACMVVPCVSAYADTLDCKGEIISIGDSRVDLVMKCGEPDGKESYEAKNKLIFDEWTYNFGPSQFMRIVSMKNGTITRIRAGGYGYNKDAKSDQSEWSGQIVSIGDLKSDVVLKCGGPSWKDSHQEETQAQIDRGLERKVYNT